MNETTAGDTTGQADPAPEDRRPPLCCGLCSKPIPLDGTALEFLLVSVGRGRGRSGVTHALCVCTDCAVQSAGRWVQECVEQLEAELSPAP